ncbi:MAG: SipW-dependent-type signal peptide-containing protein [Clostridiales bacterium]|nr:SipW-dependent-type signal peptide-containing protein [Candidatus Equinaster intestinalis]
MKSTKRSLIMSALSLVVCVTMLLGTTFAWFTSSVTSGRNTIVAGNLDVQLTHSNGKVTNQTVQDATDLFAIDYWEPGVIAYENFTVTNAGKLALKYALSLSIFDKNYYNDKDLSDVIKAAVIDGGFNPTGTTPAEKRAEAQALTFTSLADFQKKGNLKAKGTTGKDSETYGVVLYWVPSENDNLYNVTDGNSVETSVLGVTAENAGNALFIEFGVNLVATQDTVEADSFDKQYDVSAQLPVVASFNSIKKADVTDTSKSLKITKQGALESAEVKATGAKTVFESLEDKTDGRNNDMTLTLSVNEIDNKVKDVEGGKEKTLNFDINMSAVMKVTNATNGALIDTKKNDNVEKLDEFTTIVLNIGQFSAVSVLHKGVPMQKLNSATAVPTDTVNGGYFYDGESNVYLVTKTFSPFSFILTTNHVWEYTSNNNGTHNAVCKNDALHKITNEACDTDGTDGACSKCGYKKQLQKGSVMHLDVNGDGNAEDFLVLKKDGDSVEIMAQTPFVAYDGGTAWGFSDASVGARFSKSIVGTYLNGTDTTVEIQKDNTMYETAIYCTTYYGNLSKATKDAIVTQEIKQYKYNIPATKPASGEYYTSVGDKYTYWFEKKGEGHNDSTTTKPYNKFNVYVLGIEDIVDYLGKDNVTAANLKKMFPNTTDKRIWLNTQLDTNKQNGAEKGNISYLFYSNGDFNSTMPNGGHGQLAYAMPVMTLDLTKLATAYTFD